MSYLTKFRKGLGVVCFCTFFYVLGNPDNIISGSSSPTWPYLWLLNILLSLVFIYLTLKDILLSWWKALFGAILIALFLFVLWANL